MSSANDSFVRLKYEILTADPSSWHLCGTYPEDVLRKWARRCANDVEHFASDNKYAMDCIRDANSGVGTPNQLNSVCASFGMMLDMRCPNGGDEPAVDAARTAYFAAFGRTMSSVAAAISCYDDRLPKWDEYIRWLIEELGVDS